MKEVDQDEFAGQGGSYEIRDGKRVRVEVTEEHPDGLCARDASGTPVARQEAVPDGAGQAGQSAAPQRGRRAASGASSDNTSGS